MFMVFCLSVCLSVCVCVSVCHNIVMWHTTIDTHTTRTHTTPTPPHCTDTPPPCTHTPSTDRPHLPRIPTQAHNTQHPTKQKNHNNTHQDTKCNRQTRTDRDSDRCKQTQTDTPSTFHLIVLPRKSIIRRNNLNSNISAVMWVSVQRSEYPDM